MSGISYSVTIDNEAARARLQQLLDRMENRAGFFKNVGEHLLNSVQDNFENETAPNGSKWQALSSVTVGLRLRKHGNSPLTILRATGGLAGSINAQASADEVRIGTAKVYAAIQHFGGKAGRNRKVAIPARPFLGISPDDEEAIMEMAEDWLSL